MKPPPILWEDATAGEALLRTTIPANFLDANHHLNTRYYMHLFDDAGDILAAQMGLTREYHVANRTGGMDLEHHLNYLREVREEDIVSLYARIVGVTEKRWHYILFLVNETRREVSATFECVNTFVDMTTRKTALLPPFIRERIRQRMEADKSSGGTPPLCGVMAS